MDLNVVKKNLIEKKSRCQKNLERLTEEATRQVRTVAAIEDFDADEKEVTLALIDKLQENINEINRALEKVDDETYGICEYCGGKISAGRLKFLPSATVCIVCKTKEETGQDIEEDTTEETEEISKED